MAESSKTRASGFELLRIVSMLMITLHHLSMTYGLDSTDLYTRLWGQFFYIGGKVGVNCFALIGSYFLYGRRFKIERIIKLHQQLVIYGVVCLLVGIVVIPETLGFSSVAKAFFPVIFSHYWFVTIYIGLLCLSPFLNLFISKLSYIQHSAIILVCLLLFSLIPTLTAQVPYNDNLSWFCFLYIIAAYFRKYDTKIKKILSNPVVFSIMWAAIYGSSLTMTFLENYIPAFHEGINFFSGMYILPEVINSLSLFLYFEKMRFESKWVNAIAKHTLACYLIQSNYVLLFFRMKLLNFIFLSTDHLLYPLLALAVTGTVFVCSVAIDVLREKFQTLSPVQLITRIAVTVFQKSEEKIMKVVENNKNE